MPRLAAHCHAAKISPQPTAAGQRCCRLPCCCHAALFQLGLPSTNKAARSRRRGGAQAWTSIQHDGSNHLGLRRFQRFTDSVCRAAAGLRKRPRRRAPAAREKSRRCPRGQESPSFPSGAAGFQHLSAAGHRPEPGAGGAGPGGGAVGCAAGVLLPLPPSPEFIQPSLSALTPPCCPLLLPPPSAESSGVFVPAQARALGRCGPWARPSSRSSRHGGSA